MLGVARYDAILPTVVCVCVCERKREREREREREPNSRHGCRAEPVKLAMSPDGIPYGKV